MRLIGAASLVFLCAFVYALSTVDLTAGAQQQEAGAEQAATSGHHHNIGQAIFRFDTLGDEQLWTRVLRMHEVVATVDPATALSVGLKVDVEALPRSLIRALKAGEVDLTDPAVTVESLTT